MIKFIPSLIENKIERDNFLDGAFKDLEDQKHAFQVSSEEARKAIDELNRRVKRSCSIFKGTCPEEWETFEHDLIEIFGLVYILDQASPYDLISSQRKEGVNIDANYFAITKAYTRGQLDVLDQMIKAFSINRNQFNPKLNKSKMSFLKKLLTYLSNLL